MFARQVTMRIKKGAAPELARIVERDVLPVMRAQKGFRGEITLVAPDRLEAVSTSFWDDAADAEAFNEKAYAGVLESLSKVVEKNPKAVTFEVSNSTLADLASRGDAFEANQDAGERGGGSPFAQSRAHFMNDALTREARVEQRQKE